MNKKKILVTGGLGHIGSQLIREYAKREDVELIRILDNLSTQRYCSLFDLPTEKKFEFIEGDVNDSIVLERAVKDIDVVIHLAGVTDAPTTIKNPEVTRKVNLFGTQEILNASIKAGVKKFLFASSTSVYGEATGLIDETYENLKPSSPYAKTKLDAEKLVIKAAKEQGLDACVLRKGTIFGKSIGMRFHTAVNKFVYLACLKKPLTVWENAYEQKRPYLGVMDSIRAYEFLEKHGESGEIYNVLTENYTVRDIVEAIKKVVPDTKIKMTRSPILNQKSYEISNKKIKDLGFEFKDSLERGMKEKVEMFRGINNNDKSQQYF